MRLMLDTRGCKTSLDHSHDVVTTCLVDVFAPHQSLQLENRLKEDKHVTKKQKRAETCPPSLRRMSIKMLPTPLPYWSRMSTAPVTTYGRHVTIVPSKITVCIQSSRHSERRHLARLRRGQGRPHDIASFRVRFGSCDRNPHWHVATEYRI